MVNSRYPLVCATTPGLRQAWSRFFRSYACNLPSSFNIVLSSALVFSTGPPVSVSGTDYTVELFPGTSSKPSQSNKGKQFTRSVTTTRPTNINVVPIDYAFLPHLRGRLTLLRLTLSRNPWSFGEESLTPFIVTHVSIRTSDTSRGPHGSPFTAYGTLRYRASCDAPTASVYGFSPVTFLAQRPLFRPVSCYAFFK